MKQDYNPNSSDYEMTRPSGEGVRSSVKTLTMGEWFAMLPIVSGTQTRACMRCGTPMWSEGVKDFHFRGDCVAEAGELKRTLKMCSQCEIVSSNHSGECAVYPFSYHDWQPLPAAEPTVCRHNCVASICPQCATGAEPTASEPCLACHLIHLPGYRDCTVQLPPEASRTAGEAAGPPASGGKGWQRAGDTLYATASPDPLAELHRLQAEVEAERSAVPDPCELSLLVIDLGDSCVVKVEKGDRMDLVYCVKGGSFRCTKGNIVIHDSPFTEIRSAIDALEGEKEPPAIRIEATEIGSNYPYRLVLMDDTGLVEPGRRIGLMQADYHALSELAGKPLPVWKPKVGKWVRFDASVGDWAGCVIEKDQKALPFGVWRFTLTEGE